MPRVDSRFLDSERAGAVVLAVLVSLGLLLQPTRSAAADKIRIALADRELAENEVLAIEPNETLNLRALAFDDDNPTDTEDVTAETIFESRKEEVVQVTGRTVRGIGYGETAIRAIHPPSGEDAEVDVTVLLITALAIQPGDATVAVGATVQVRAFATLENGRTGVDVTSLV